MKTLLLTLTLVLCAAPCFAGSCSDTQSAASNAIKERNATVKESHNNTMPDPEEDRGGTLQLFGQRCQHRRCLFSWCESAQHGSDHFGHVQQGELRNPEQDERSPERSTLLHWRHWAEQPLPSVR